MILTTEQIQVIRRDVEAYLANNRKLKPRHWTPSNHATIVGDRGCARRHNQESCSNFYPIPYIERITLRVQLAQAEFLNSRFAQDIAGEATEASFHKTEFHTPIRLPFPILVIYSNTTNLLLPASPPQAQVPEPYVDQEVIMWLWTRRSPRPWNKCPFWIL